ncbi:uncharacterized protein BDCG_02156 [Blastomyces dermatitidis ER-3]|uniref:Uncharacterized protein n=3 Tax=Blastomyces TaxID=229219 RepID=A0A179UKE5_BLAGS|nr:uncharacterized protein BDBG_03736 [Blastomyces gilchristii SLH14081]XP_045274445.1 uncharacterized protein BDCG_02156 [Blastomyces dermatitidis ER-3]EGE79830.2 hypothetical protein BDDG_02771 [Blastomyces dermatitidis ATCC 18188]EQL33246.1 hypothetical protein BDFG_04689 [Blastomyces dermatitidis ATCC 26199]EEQ87036.2 hypothetical protein BDCG_02156 [Blastomyces dermatitidis ER-3]OAT07698.1 hypothetical protein BDBG_03736 [Blastomyces gilchristii SLH14081]
MLGETKVFRLCQLPSTANLAVQKHVNAQHRPSSSVLPLLKWLAAIELSIRINIGGYSVAPGKKQGILGSPAQKKQGDLSSQLSELERRDKPNVGCGWF